MILLRFQTVFVSQWQKPRDFTGVAQEKERYKGLSDIIANRV